MTRADLRELAEGLSERQVRVITALDGEYRPKPGMFRLTVAAVAYKLPSLVEREWQDGCAQSTYYRLTPLGLALRNHLQSEGNS